MDKTVTNKAASAPAAKKAAMRGRISLFNETIPLQTLLLLPQDTAAKYKAIIFRDQIDRRTRERTLSIATVNPNIPEIQQLVTFLQSHNNVAVDLYEATQEEIEVQLSRYIGADPGENVDSNGNSSADSQDIETVEQLQQVVQSAIIPSIVTGIINFALKRKASDVHIEPLEDTVRVRYRVDGLLITTLVIPRYFRNAIISRIKILSQMKIDEQRVPQDGRFELDWHGHAIDIRVSTLPTVHGEKVVMRLLDKDAGLITLEQLGITGSSFDALVKAINHPYGVIMSTGPTGSGKSTSLYAILNRIAKPDRNVVTLEDPVEYQIDGVNQSQVKPVIGYTFASGLRSILRQDPNIIMVGEVRDLETASLVTHAALTGHLVLTTLHTNDSAGALPRLINMGVEPFLLTSSLRAVIAQRLVRKLCVACRQQIKLPKGLLDEIHDELSQLKGFPVSKQTDYMFYQAVGCDQCTDGYSGRSGIFEVLTMSETIESLAVNKQPSSVIANAAKQEGMITLKQDGILKALKGITSIDEVLRVTSDG